MDHPQDQAAGVGEEDIDALLRALEGMPSDGDDSDDEEE